MPYLDSLNAVRYLCPELIHHHVELPQGKLGELDLQLDILLGGAPLLDIGVVLEQSRTALQFLAFQLLRSGSSTEKIVTRWSC